MSEHDRHPISIDSISQEDIDKVESRTIEVEFYLPENLPIHYADNFNVFFSDYDFTLTYMQTEAPLIIKDEDWEKVESIRAKSVVRVVVPPHLIPRIVNVLSENWKKFLAARKKQLQEQANVNATKTAEADDSSSEGSQS